MPEPSKLFRIGPTSRYETDAFHRNSFQVFYDGESPTIEFIELSRGFDVRAFSRNLDVFATPADVVVVYISRDAAYDQTHRQIPCGYVFRELQLSLWRPTIPESDTDTDGRYISTVEIGRVGCQDMV